MHTPTTPALPGLFDPADVTNPPPDPALVAEREREAVLALVRELLEAHYSAIILNADEKGDLHASFRVTIKRGSDPVTAKVALSAPVPSIKDGMPWRTRRIQ